MKKRKPDFIKQMGRQKKRLAGKWRKPRGSDSKIRVGKKDYPKKIKIGFKSPKGARGLSRAGFNIIEIINIDELKEVNKEKDIVCLRSIGKRKKIEIVKECIKLGLNILNMKDPSGFLKNVEEDFKKKKEDKKKKEQEKKKKEVKKKGEEKKKGIEAKVDDQKSDKEKEDKKEKDKVLTKREL